jgi:PAS domain S-box-containing protein
MQEVFMSSGHNRIGHELRKRAEALLEKFPDIFKQAELESITKLAHELNVHQAELELQNEELRNTYQDLAESRERFAALYEYAPVGYAVLDSSGIVRQTNTTLRNMLNRENAVLNDTPFSEFIFEQDAKIFLSLFKSFFRNPDKKQILVRMNRAQDAPFYAAIEARPSIYAGLASSVEDALRNELMVVVSDVSDLHKARQQVLAQNEMLKKANERKERSNGILRTIRQLNQFISQRDDRKELIKDVCRVLQQNGLYKNSWIALLSDSGREMPEFVQFGFELGWGAFSNRLARGEFPECLKKAIETDGVIVQKNPQKNCPTCPVAKQYAGNSAFLRRLAFGKRIYGVINVSVPSEYNQDSEELDLFEEIVNDLGFALHKIESMENLHRAREQVRYSEDKFLRIFQASPDGLFLTQLPEERIFDVNQGFALLTGYSPEEAFESTSKELGLWVDPEAKQEYINLLLRNSAVSNYEAVFRAKDGSLFTALVSGAVILTSKDKFFLNILRDITARKEMEAERATLFSAVEQAGEAFIITDLTGMIKYVNSAFEHITGYNIAEVLGKKPNILKSGHHDRSFYRNMWQTLTSGKTWAGKLTNKRKDGSIFIEDAVISPVFNEKGEMDNFIAVKRDITAEIKMEETLRQAQKMEAIGTLAGGIAHDFNNILTAISGFSEMALEDAEKGEPRPHELKIILKSTERAKNLVKKILLFSRKFDFSPRPLNLNHLIKDFLPKIQAERSSEITIELKLDSDLNPINGDAAQMEQIFLNLADNALDAMPQGGKLVIETKNILINEDTTNGQLEVPDGSYVMLVMTDSGHGMQKEVLDRIFDPFFTTKEVGKGTGLGLASVYGAVKSHGGYVKCHSEPEKGSSFSCFFQALELDFT